MESLPVLLLGSAGSNAGPETVHLSGAGKGRFTCLPFQLLASLAIGFRFNLVEKIKNVCGERSHLFPVSFLRWQTG